MQTLKVKSRIDDDGHLRLDVPTDLPTGDIELVLVIESAKTASGAPYDLTDLAGKLGWTGDAVQEQRKLRDEWPS